MHDPVRRIANSLNHGLREMLMEHACGPVRISVGERHKTRKALVARKLIGTSPGARPAVTFLTDAGRAVVCLLLADYADALVKHADLIEVPAEAVRVQATWAELLAREKTGAD